MKIKEIQVNPEYAHLFKFKSKAEEIEHAASMISYRVLSEVEKVCEQRKLNRSDLAKLIKTSKSYITQLFQGSKQVNTTMMAKFEDALDVSFEIKLKLDEISYEHYLGDQLTTKILNARKMNCKEGTWLYYPSHNQKGETEAYLKTIHSKGDLYQKIG